MRRCGSRRKEPGGSSSTCQSTVAAGASCSAGQTALTRPSPPAPEDGVRQVTPSVLLVLAACLGCCWPPGQDRPYPGVPAPETEVLEALDRFTQGPGTARPVAGGTRAARSRALRLLRASGFLEPAGSDGLVRLGPEIAAWGDRDIQRLRDRFEDFPGVQGGVS